MDLRIGLNPYGLSYYLGLHAAGTPRANPKGVGLEGFIAMAQELGARALELPENWLKPMSDADMAALKARLDGLDMVPVISSGLQNLDIELCIRAAKTLGASCIRAAMTPILCGDRHAAGQRWHDLVASCHEKLALYAPMAAAASVTLLIENHQDFTSRELVNFCDEYGPSVRIVFDMANTFPVAESPLDFTRVIAPYVRYCHAKDYNVQFTSEGIRLIRCATGDGAVPHKEMFDILSQHNDTMLAAIEVGALDARHVKLFTPDWWRGYAPKDAEALAACLLAAQRNRLADDAEWRTPWERGDDAALIDYELGQVRKSAENLKALGLM